MTALWPVVSISLSWLAGGLMVRAILPGRSDAHLAVQIGYGFLVGTALTAAFIAGSRLLGMQMSWTPIALSLLLVSGAALFLPRIASREPVVIEGFREWIARAHGWQVGLFLALLAWLAFRVLIVGLEAGLRPLYAWDGWMHWSPKAKIWIETGQWYDFVSRTAWLADAERSGYTFRNWSYPDFVPLVQTWVLMPLERWDPVRYGYPWIALYAALLPTAYGTARFSGFGPLGAAVTAWVLVSLPFVHVHAALPGYADLWLGAYVGTAAGSLMLASSLSQRRWLLLAVVLGAVCAWIKVPGIAWMAVVFSGVLAYLLTARAVGLLMTVAVAAVVLVLLIGIDVQVSGAGRIAISTTGFDLPVVGQYEWQLNPVFGVILADLAMSSNWHFFWPACVVLYMGSALSALRDDTARACWLLFVLGAAFLFAALLLTSRGANIETTEMTHRAFLPLAILAVMTAPALIRAWRGGSSDLARTATGDENP